MIPSRLRTRQDVYSGYSEAAFVEALTEHFKITDMTRFSKSERVLYLYYRK